MARTTSYDRDAVVRDARNLFWRSGYENASIPDLETATGLSRSSIYNEFGSKRGLFDAAVQSYLDEIVRPRLRPLFTAPVSPSALGEYLDGLRNAFEHVESMPAANGCLLVNTTGAELVHDPDVAEIIADYHRELREAFRNGAAAHLQTATPTELTALAETITGLVIAAFVLVRADRTRALDLLTTARASLRTATN